jgi:hypothetical protein
MSPEAETKGIPGYSWEHLATIHDPNYVRALSTRRPTPTPTFSNSDIATRK